RPSGAQRVLASPNWRDGRFHNLARAQPRVRGNRLPLLGELFFGDEQRTPPAPLPVDSPLASWARAPQSPLRVTWLGHSTVHLEADGLGIPTDPSFGQRPSPVGFAGPRRSPARPPPPQARP